MHTVLQFKKYVAKTVSSKTNFRANILEIQSEQDTETDRTYTNFRKLLHKSIKKD